MVNGKSFGSGVVLMGMLVVEVQPLFTIFHGLEASFIAVNLVAPCMLCVIVVLVTTAITIDLSSLSLLLGCACSCWLDIIVFFSLGLCMGLSVLSSIACGAFVVLFFLLFGSQIHIGVAVG